MSDSTLAELHWLASEGSPSLSRHARIILARNEGRTLTREVILESVWNNEESLDNIVNFHITSLRKKIDANFETKLIHTVHGFGYVMRSPEGG